MYKLMRAYCVAQETLLNAKWCPEKEQVWRGEDICIHITDSFCCTGKTNTMS